MKDAEKHTQPRLREMCFGTGCGIVSGVLAFALVAKAVSYDLQVGSPGGE
jgi:hypothetical protein